LPLDKRLIRIRDAYANKHAVSTLRTLSPVTIGHKSIGRLPVILLDST